MKMENETGQGKSYLKMSELSSLSGVPVSRIRYYIRKGLLSKGAKINRTTALYTDQHLRQLELLKKGFATGPPADRAGRRNEGGRTQERGNPPPEDEGPQVMREAIVVSAVPLFQRKGYERVTITDIAQAANISRNTFYQYFKDKKELFVACLSKLFLEWRQEAPDETTPIRETIRTIALAFCRVYPRWSAMMNIFRAMATKAPEEFGPRLEESMNVRIDPIASDLARGIEQGIFRDVDARLAAMSLAGQLDYVLYFMARGAFGDQDAQSVVENALDIFFNGINRE
jgi:AcrR family transcriptional regulator